MTLRMFLLSMLVFVPMVNAQPVDLGRSPCLQPPMQISPLTGVPPLSFPAGSGQTWDARDQAFVQNQMTGAGVLAPERGSNTCILGATIVGPIGDDVAWRSSTKPDGIQHYRPNGPYQVHGASIRRVNDALSPPKAPDTSRAATFSYRDIYAREIRDDLLENDACLGGEIVDSLFDGVHMGISQRPGGRNVVDLGPTMPVVKIKNVTIRLTCQRDVRGGNTCPAGQSHAQWWKLSSSYRTSDGRVGPLYEIDNLVLYAEHASRRGVKQMIPLPPANQIKSATNVVVLYTGPGRLPAASVPITVIIDRAEVARVYNERRAEWLDDHGCDQNGDNCRFLQSEGWPPPPPPPPEPPEITAMYNAVSGLDAASRAVQGALRTGNLRRVGRNTGATHSQHLHDAVHAMMADIGDRPALLQMHTQASRSIERAAALAAAVDAGDQEAAELAAQPELTEAIAQEVIAVRQLYK